MVGEYVEPALLRVRERLGAREHRVRALRGAEEQRLQAWVDLGTGDEGLAHRLVAEDPVTGVQLEPVRGARAWGVEVADGALRRCGLELVGLGVVDHVDLAGLQCGVARGRVRQEPPRDAGQARLRRAPVVGVLRQGDAVAVLPAGDPERAGADGGLAVRRLLALERLRRLHADPGLREGLEQRAVRSAQRQRDGALVGGGRLRDGLQRQVAGARGGGRVLHVLDVRHDRGGVERGAVAEGDVVTQGERQGLPVVARGPLRREFRRGPAVLEPDELLDVLRRKERLRVVAADVRVEAGRFGVARGVGERAARDRGAAPGARARSAAGSKDEQDRRGARDCGEGFLY